MIQAWVLALTLSFSRSVNLGKTLPWLDPQLLNLFNGALAKAISNFLTPPPINTHTHTHFGRGRALCIWTPGLAAFQASILLPPFLALLSGVGQMRGVFRRS